MSVLRVGLLALLAALLITSLYQPRPLEAQLLHLQVQQAMPEQTDVLDAEPPALQALFLAYADDPILLAKARLAMLRHPEIARPILLAYGSDEAFQAVLRDYGEDVVLPIRYFVENPIFTLEMMRGMSEAAQSALGAFRRLWGAHDAAGTAATQGPLTPEERGAYAIHFIAAEGYGFLGQFVLAPDGTVHWLQTERVLEGLNSLFAGGLRGLESKVRRDEAIGAGDIGWAALDVAVGVSAFKILRMGRGAAAAGTLTYSQRSAAIGAGLWRGSVIGARVAKYGAPAVLAYVAIRHPSVINSMLGSVAERLGLPVGLVQVVGWTLVLFPVLLLLRFLLGPLAWLLAGGAGLLKWGGRALMAR